MHTLKAIVKDHRLELDVPPDWPDGTEVEIQRVEQSSATESDRLTQEEIARTLTAIDQIQPFDWSEEERAAWEAERQARKAREKARFFEHAEELRRMWE